MRMDRVVALVGANPLPLQVGVLGGALPVAREKCSTAGIATRMSFKRDPCPCWQYYYSVDSCDN